MRFLWVGQTLAGGLTALLTAASTQAALINVSNPQNLLAGSGATVTASDAGISGLNTTSAVIDNLAPDTSQDASFIFANTANEALSIAGFSAPGGFQTIRIFAAPGDASRVPTSVSAYSSTTVTSSLTPASYSTSLGTFNAPFVFHPYSPDDPTGAGRGYFDLSVSAPASTKSLLLTFSSGPASTRVYEVQALPEPAAFAVGAVGLLGLMRRPRARC